MDKFSTLNCISENSQPHNVFQRTRRSGLLGLFDLVSEKKDKIKEDLFGRNKMF